MSTGYLPPGFEEVERRFDSIERRLARVKAETENLRSKVDTLYGPDRYDLVRELHDKGRQHVYRITRLVQPPPELALDIGVIFHLLRSSLDHTVNALGLCEAIANPTRNPDDWEDKAEFPIFKADTKYLGGGRKKRRIEELHQDVVQAVDDVQPFAPHPNRLDPERQPLWVVNDLNVIDKHRYLHVLVERVRATKYVLPEGVPPPSEAIITKPVEDGDVILLYTFTDPQPDIDLQVRVRLTLALQEVLPPWRMDILTGLEKFMPIIRDVITKVARADPRFAAWPGFAL